MSLRKQAISGMAWTFAQQFSGQAITFIVSIILARLLLPSEFGLIAMIGIFVGFGNVLINSGLTQSIIRTENPNEDDFSTVFYFNLITSVLIYGFFYFSAPYISLFYHQYLLTNIIRVYAIIFVIEAFSAIQITRLTKLMDFKTQMKVSIPSLILAGIVGIVMAYKGYGVWSLVASAIVKSTFSTIQLWFWSKWMPLWRFSWIKFKLHYKFGIKLMFSGLLDIVFSNAYIIIIGRYFAPAQVGFYNRADSLQKLPVSNIASVLNKVTYPLFAQIQNDDVRLKSVYKKIMQMVIFLIAPVLIIMSFLAEPLFRLLFTEKWLPAVPYFQILCLNGILYPIHAYNLNILKVKGHSDLFLKLELVKRIIIVIMIAIAFQFGIFGLLYGSVIASILCFFVNTHYSGKYLDYTAWSQIKDLLPIIFIALIAGLATYFLDYFMKNNFVNDFFRLFIGGIAGVGIYILISNVFKVSSLKEFKTIILKK